MPLLTLNGSLIGAWKLRISLHCNSSVFPFDNKRLKLTGLKGTFPGHWNSRYSFWRFLEEHFRAIGIPVAVSGAFWKSGISDISATANVTIFYTCFRAFIREQSGLGSSIREAIVGWRIDVKFRIWLTTVLEFCGSSQLRSRFWQLGADSRCSRRFRSERFVG